jgi:oligopeptide/dipeptide ABC transporter ATP-binding protein
LSSDEKSRNSPLLKVSGLSKTFISRGLFGASRPVVAVADVSFTVDRGEAVALVGESGSGKSTIARILLRLERPEAGRILLDGEDILAREPRRASLTYRGRVQMVFQDPFGSLNRTHDIAHHLARPLLRHKEATAGDVYDKSIELLHAVGLEPPEEFISRRPYELSGGQRQRVAIARALAVDPDLLIADEPTSMLDVSIRMDILTLLADLKDRRRLAMLLITHDLASARYLSDTVLVLFRGRIVEGGPADELVVSPAHPYTRALLDSIADVGELGEEPEKVDPDLEERPAGGCPFAPRCPDVMDICWKVDPSYRTVESRRVRCHLYPEDAEPVTVRPENADRGAAGTADTGPSQE